MTSTTIPSPAMRPLLLLGLLLLRPATGALPQRKVFAWAGTSNATVAQLTNASWKGIPEELLAFNHAEEAAGVAAATEEKVGVRKTSSLAPFCTQNDHFTNTGSGQT